MHTVRDKKKSGAYAATSSSLSIPGWTHLLMGKLFFFMPAGIMGNILFCFMDADRHVLSSMLHASPTHFAFAMLCIGKTTLRPCPTDHAWPQTSAAETVMVCKKEQEYFEYLYVVAPPGGFILDKDGHRAKNGHGNGSFSPRPVMILANPATVRQNHDRAFLTRKSMAMRRQRART